MADCQHCKRPTGGAVICGKCKQTCDIALANIAAYLDDMSTLRTKQVRYGASGKGSIGKTRPLGMDLRFAGGGVGTKAEDQSRRVLVKWAGELAAYTSKPRHIDSPSLVGYLLRHLNLVVGKEWAPAMLKDLLDLERKLRHVIDRPPDSWYAGVCGAVLEDDRPHDGTTCACSCHNGIDCLCDVPGGCGTEIAVIPGSTCHRTLYAQPGQAFVRCRDCRTQWDVADRRDELLKEAEDYEVTVRMLARIVTTLGTTDASEAKLESRINTWVHRGRLTSHGKRVGDDGRPRPVYRVGDVLDLLTPDVKEGA